MVPPDADRSKRLPTMSWESVVDAPPAPSPAATEGVDAPSAPVDANPAPPVPIPPLVAPAPPAVDSSGAAVAFAPPPPPPPPAPSAPAQVRTAPPSTVVPAVADVLGGVDAGPASVAPVSDELPTIVEATPVPMSEPLTELPQIHEATPPEPALSGEVAAEVSGDVSGPRLPPVAQPVQRATTPATPIVAPVQDAPASAPTPRQRGARRGFKLVLAFVILGGLVAAAIIVGLPYLFPNEWDEGSAPYGAAVEQGSETEIEEPVAVTTEPTADFSERYAAQLLAPYVDAAPQWRALGLATGEPTTAELATQLAGLRAAMYSTSDGQTYADESAAEAVRDSQITQAVAAAALDQEFQWSQEQAERTLDDRAATSAQVLGQVGAIQEASEFSEPVTPITPDQVAAMPVIIAHDVLAPQLYAAFHRPSDGDDAPLDDLGTGGPGLFLPASPTAATPAQMVGTDTPTTSAIPMDRSYWFLTFAGFLDPLTSYFASEAIVENSVSMAERGATDCVYATFSGGGVEQTATLRSALEQWSAAVPSEFTSSFSVLPDGSLQLVSCDPGTTLQTPVRPSALRELLTWRVAELATIEAVRASGTTDVDGGVADAWPFVVNSGAIGSLMELPLDASPADIAETARAGVAAIFTPAG